MVLFSPNSFHYQMQFGAMAPPSSLAWAREVNRKTISCGYYVAGG
jgi:hypothetical protein